jgi:predicted MFS family arabinose efflux permease
MVLNISMIAIGAALGSAIGGALLGTGGYPLIGIAALTFALTAALLVRTGRPERASLERSV